MFYSQYEPEVDLYPGIGTRPVIVLSGSKTDADLVMKGLKKLEDAKISYEYHILSAHRNVRDLGPLIKEIMEAGQTYVIQCYAGKLAALFGAVEAEILQNRDGKRIEPYVFAIPVEGDNPIDTTAAILSHTQLPKDVAVHGFGPGLHGALNANFATIRVVQNAYRMIQAARAGR